MTPQTTRILDIRPHAARMEQPLVSYRQVHPAGRSPAPAPGFIFGPSNADLARSIYGQIDTPEVGVFAIAHAAVAPTGIALCGHTAFFSAALNLPREHVATITRRLDAAPLPVRGVPGPLVPLFGPAEESYAQLLVDYLPRLWLLERAGYALSDVRFLVPASLPPVAEDVLAQLHLPADNLVRYAHWEEVIETDLLLLPTTLRLHDRLGPHFAEATAFWTARVRPAATIAPHRRLYVWSPGELTRASFIEAIAAGQGYEIVDTGTMDLAARAQLFSAASHVVGAATHALLDTVFAPPGTRVCAVRDTSRDAGFLQSGVGAALGHETGYVFGPIDEADYRRALEVMGL